MRGRPLRASLAEIARRVVWPTTEPEPGGSHGDTQIGSSAKLTSGHMGPRAQGRTAVASVSDARVLCFATQGHEHLDGERIRELLEPLRPEVYPFDSSSKLRSAVGLLRAVRAQRPQLI